MPYKNPEKRKQKAREYAKAYADRQPEKPIGICSVIGCSRPSAPNRRRCQHHISYANNFKKVYREKPIPEGLCSNYPDCSNVARTGLKLCESCGIYRNEQTLRPENKIKRRDRYHRLKVEIFSAYGGSCKCCSEQLIEFLSIDHIDGYKGEGPRNGWQLYQWIKNNDFPGGYRVLCMSCNFALGHAGFCSHNGVINLVCNNMNYDEKYKNSTYNNLRHEVFLNYGGYVCACCGDTSWEHLTIDHINNNGSAHRKELTGNSQNGTTLYYWLRNNNFPSGFQILCMNCNFAKGHFGICPHEQNRNTVIT